MPLLPADLVLKKSHSICSAQLYGHSAVWYSILKHTCYRSCTSLNSRARFAYKSCQTTDHIIRPTSYPACEFPTWPWHVRYGDCVNESHDITSAYLWQCVAHTHSLAHSLTHPSLMHANIPYRLFVGHRINNHVLRKAWRGFCCYIKALPYLEELGTWREHTPK